MTSAASIGLPTTRPSSKRLSLHATVRKPSFEEAVALDPRRGRDPRPNLLAQRYAIPLIFFFLKAALIPLVPEVQRDAAKRVHFLD